MSQRSFEQTPTGLFVPSKAETEGRPLNVSPETIRGFSKLIPGGEEEHNFTDFGAPHLRTDWNVQSISLACSFVTEWTTSWKKQFEKKVIEGQVATLLGSIKVGGLTRLIPITSFRASRLFAFKEFSPTIFTAIEIEPRQTYGLELYSPLIVSMAQSLSMEYIIRFATSGAEGHEPTAAIEAPTMFVVNPIWQVTIEQVFPHAR